MRASSRPPPPPFGRRAGGPLLISDPLPTSPDRLFPAPPGACKNGRLLSPPQTRAVASPSWLVSDLWKSPHLPRSRGGRDPDRRSPCRPPPSPRAPGETGSRASPQRVTKAKDPPARRVAPASPPCGGQHHCGQAGSRRPDRSLAGALSRRRPPGVNAWRKRHRSGSRQRDPSRPTWALRSPILRRSPQKSLVVPSSRPRRQRRWLWTPPSSCDRCWPHQLHVAAGYAITPSPAVRTCARPRTRQAGRGGIGESLKVNDVRPPASRESPYDYP